MIGLNEIGKNFYNLLDTADSTLKDMSLLIFGEAQIGGIDRSIKLARESSKKCLEELEAKIEYLKIPDECPEKIQRCIELARNSSKENVQDLEKIYNLLIDKAILVGKYHYLIGDTQTGSRLLYQASINYKTNKEMYLKAEDLQKQFSLDFANGMNEKIIPQFSKDFKRNSTFEIKNPVNKTFEFKFIDKKEALYRMIDEAVDRFFKNETLKTKIGEETRIDILEKELNQMIEIEVKRVFLESRIRLIEKVKKQMGFGHLEEGFRYGKGDKEMYLWLVKKLHERVEKRVREATPLERKMKTERLKKVLEKKLSPQLDDLRLEEHLVYLESNLPLEDDKRLIKPIQTCLTQTVLNEIAIMFTKCFPGMQNGDLSSCSGNPYAEYERYDKFILTPPSYNIPKVYLIRSSESLKSQIQKVGFHYCVEYALTKVNMSDMSKKMLLGNAAVAEVYFEITPKETGPVIEFISKSMWFNSNPQQFVKGDFPLKGDQS